MPRITPPFSTEGSPIFQAGPFMMEIPVDLPEGGHLCVIVGQNPTGVPVPSVALAPGSMVGVIPPQLAEHIRPAIIAALEERERQRQQRMNGTSGDVRP